MNYWCIMCVESWTLYKYKFSIDIYSSDHGDACATINDSSLLILNVPHELYGDLAHA